jgi:hypothetical protein
MRDFQEQLGELEHRDINKRRESGLYRLAYNLYEICGFFLALTGYIPSRFIESRMPEFSTPLNI